MIELPFWHLIGQAKCVVNASFGRVPTLLGDNSGSFLAATCIAAAVTCSKASAAHYYAEPVHALKTQWLAW